MLLTKKNTQILGTTDSSNKDRFLEKITLSTSKGDVERLLQATWIDTPLGLMVAIADEQQLYLLDFFEKDRLEREIEGISNTLKIGVVPGDNVILDQVRTELHDYCNGSKLNFTVPIFTMGSHFQKQVWQALQKIPLGETISYQQLAFNIGNPTACRAVANANGKNQLAIIIPCHRVINKNGAIGGYAGGIARKKWLLDHENANLRRQLP